MSERSETFPVDEVARLSVRLRSGDVRIVPGEPGALTVRLIGSGRDLERMTLERRGDTIVVESERGGGLGRFSSVDVLVSAGAPVHLRLRSAAGELDATAPLASLIADSASGDLAVGEVHGEVTVKSASGDLRVEHAGGRVDVSGAAGDVRIGRAEGPVEARTAAGDVTIGEAAGEVTVRSASGDVEVGRFEGGSFDAKTLSGDVRLGLPGGRRYDVSLQTLSGDVRTDFPVSGEGGGAPARLRVASMSGDVVLRPAE